MRTACITYRPMTTTASAADDESLTSLVHARPDSPETECLGRGLEHVQFSNAVKLNGWRVMARTSVYQMSSLRATLD